MRYARAWWRLVVGLFVALAVIGAVVVGQTSSSAARGRQGAGSGSPGAARTASASTPLPTRGQQEQILDSAYARMVRTRDPFVPGPGDVTDYGIERLWSRGIDGAGTTVAVLGLWDDPQITSQLAAFDRGLGLPSHPGSPRSSRLGIMRFQADVHRLWLILSTTAGAGRLSLSWTSHRST